MDERLLQSEANDVGGLLWRVSEESKKIWRVTFPAILSRVTAFGIFVVTQAFVGHLGTTELAAYAVMQILGVRFVLGILIGMSSATETLCGQAYGAKQYHMLGIYLQRSWIVNFITATIFLPIFFLGTPILKLLNENEEIAEAAGQLGPWFIPQLYAMAFSLTLQQYLQCQLKNQIVAWLSTTLFVVHLFLSWLFVSVFNLGINGAMGAMIISTWSMLIGQLIYVFGGWCPDTWTGFTFAAFSDLWPVVKLSVSSGVMLCLEMWYNSILVLLAGYMKNAAVAISAFSIWYPAKIPPMYFLMYFQGILSSFIVVILSLNISAWEFMICLGFLVGVSVRVSNELGQGNAKAAHFAVKVVLGTSTVIGVILWILCLLFGRELAYLFTSDEDVVETVSSLSVLLAFTILLNSIQPVFSGVAVGCGRQGMVAWVNIGSYYMIGIPLGVVLGYVANLEVRGIWLGMIIGVATQTLVLGTIIGRTNWEAQVEKAAERLSKWFLKKPDNEDDPEDSAREALNGE